MSASVRVRIFGLIFTAAWLTCVGEEAAATTIRYNVTSLGTLGGGTSYAEGINNKGQVVGFSYTGGSNSIMQAFLYDGSMHNLGNPAGMVVSAAYGINGSGEIVGYTVAPSPAAWHAFTYIAGSWTDLGTFGGDSSQAWAVNSNGQVAGWANAGGPANTQDAFLYTPGKPTVNIGTAFTYGSQSLSVNGTGDVVGYSLVAGGTLSHAFLYDHSTGAVSDLGMLPNYSQSSATAINDSGQIVGYSKGLTIGSTFEPYYSHAFLISGGTMIDIDGSAYSNRDPNGSQAFAINNSGQVVGAYGPGAFIYSGGVMTNLNTLIDPNSGWTLTEATGINDLGQIVGFGSSPSGNTQAFLLTPVPEPAAGALLLPGAALLAARRRIGRSGSPNAWHERGSAHG